MKIKTSKLLAVLCTLAMMLATFVPMFTLSVSAADTEIEFNLGADGSASHADGSSKTNYSETVDGYTLNLTNVSNFYTGARDAKGNSCIKLGSSKNAGGFSLTVPNDVTSVVICIGKYKTNTTKIKVNETAYTLSNASNNGAYDEITVDTSSTKTVTLTTVSGGYRAMVNTIKFIISGSSEPDCEHTNIVAIQDANDATCTEAGNTAGEKCADCGEVLTEVEEIPATGHNYVDGICSVCSAEKPAIVIPTEPIKYTFSSYTPGEQYAEETHTLDDYLNVYVKDAHFTTQLRIYSSSSNNGQAILKATEGLTIKGLAFNAGNKVDTLNVYGSNDQGATWTLIQGVSITSTSYKDYTVSNTFAYSWIKLDVAGTQQVRVASITVTYGEVSTVCQHTNTKVLEAKEATCTTDGLTEGIQCLDCEQIIKVQETIPASHKWDDGTITTQPDCTTAGEKTYTCTVCDETQTETIDALGHKFVDGVCTECGEELPDYSGRYYIATIRAEGNYWYMTNDLGTGNTKRYTAVDSGLTELPASITAPETGYVFVLVNNYDGTYYIYAEGVEGDNYLGWTSGNSGTLVDQDSAKKFTIKTTDEGLFNIYFDDRYLSLNGTSGNDYFAFYAGTQRQDLALVPVVEAPAGEITGVQLELGTDLSLRYQIAIAEGESYENFKMVFTLGEKTVEATTTDGKFKLDGIAPDQMDDIVTATLYKGDTVVDTLEYSIKAYLDTIVTGEYDEKTVALAEALLIYGAAAQKHQGDPENALVTTKTPNVTDADKPESALSMTQVADKIEGSSVSFKSVGVRFSHVNKLYVALENDPTHTVTVKVNGKNAEIVDGYVYTNAISPADFDEVYTFELYVDGTHYQTVEYSVNSYISAKWNDASGLAKALYNYERAFVAYINP